MDYLSLIRKPVERDLAAFNALFAEALDCGGGLLGQALCHIRQRAGKRMRPLLVLLSARNHGGPGLSALQAAVGLELLHTASLVHDDVVDDSGERRGQPSVNAVYDNKVAVLVGDYLLSTSLLAVSRTDSCGIVSAVAELGRTLSRGEILQLSNISAPEVSEEVYFEVIGNKTAALFEACASIGAVSAGASDEEAAAAAGFGRDIGCMFQIRDDIFDYYPKAKVGKPTGNDMAEGKLTLPAIYALNNGADRAMWETARKVKARTASAGEIAALVAFAEKAGGIDYAKEKMAQIRDKAERYVDERVADSEVADALRAYIAFVVDREE